MRKCEKWLSVILVGVSLAGTAQAAKQPRYATGLIIPQDADLGVPFLSRMNAKIELPSNYDLRVEGFVSPVKNQGSCGSCWAFAGVAAMESAVMKVNGSVAPDLSEQQIVSCDTRGHGCSGGWQPFEYMKSTGVGTEADFPYAARNTSCKQVSPAAKALRWGNIGGANRRATVDEVRQAVVDFGALWITVGANSNWMNVSSSGKISSCSNTQVNHAVTLAGYATEETSNGLKTNFVIKNSWGKGWGDKGYTTTPLGCNNLGSVVSFVVPEGHLCTPPDFGMGPKVELALGDNQFRLAALENAGLEYTWSQVGSRASGVGAINLASNTVEDYVVETKNACGTWSQKVRIAVK